MPLPPRPQRAAGESVWLKIRRARQFVTVVSHCAYFVGHWDKINRRSRRCGGDLCVLCQEGCVKVPYIYVGVETDTGERKLMEIHNRSRHIAENLEELGSAAIGQQLCVWKDGDASNSPIGVALSGFEDAKEWDIWPVIAQVGLPPLLSAQVEGIPNQTDRDPLRVSNM